MVFPASQDLKSLDDYAARNFVGSIDDTEATFGETVSAGFDMVLNEERTDSAHRAFRPHFEKRRQAIIAAGGDAELAQWYEIAGPERMAELKQLVDAVGPDRAKERRSDSDAVLIDAIIQERQFEAMFPGTVKSDAQIATEVSAELAERRQVNQSILERGSGVGGFLGSAGALVTDPFILATAPLGPGSIVGRGLFGNAARAFATEGGIALGAEIPIQMQVAQFKAEIDSPWTYKDIAFNVLSATIGAGALRAAGSLTVDVMSAQLAAYKALPKAARTEESESAADIIERIIESEKENPLIKADQPDEPAPSQFAHERAQERARAQLEAGEPVDVSDQVGGFEPQTELDAISRSTLEDVETLGPDDLIVDAKRFQFKEGGDAQGVTTTLADVDRFDRSLAGQLLVWQDKKGKLFVVDGHQRVGIGKRALAAGQDPNEVTFSAFVLKESNGITDIDAVRIGAIRNLSASTGSALDAAKVLRGIGPAGEALLPPMSPNNALLRQGRFIARMGDDAFNAAVNNVIPQRQAAIVGELISGDAEQLAAINGLAKLKPANQVQARMMVEQMRAAGFKKQVTQDLFGEREIAQSLIRERAQVVDAALKEARSDRATFGGLVSRGTDIEDVGANRLDSGANRAKVEESGQAIEIISRLANTKGPVSEAIDKAAREVAEGKKPGDVIGAVLEAVGRATDAGDTGRGTPGVVRARGAPADTEQFLESQRALTLDDIYDVAEQRQASLVAALEGVDGEIVDPGVKLRATAERKIKRKSYDTPGRLTDIVRASVLTDAGGDDVLEALARQFEVLDEGPSATALGFARRPLLVKFEGGQIGEVQVVSPAMWKAKKSKGNALYNKFRKLSPEDQAGEAGQELRAKSVELYEKTGAGASGKAAAKSASESGIPDSSTSAASTGSQAPPGARTATALSEPSTESTAAGRDSQSSSSITDTSLRDGGVPAQEKITVPPRSGAGIPDEGAATGYISDVDYETVLAKYADYDEEAGELIEVARVAVDEFGELETEVVPARTIMRELDDTERALAEIKDCVV